MINSGAELHPTITRYAQPTSEWVHSFADIGTDAGHLRRNGPQQRVAYR